jgi:F1F0 ATPase subunit 2
MIELSFIPSLTLALLAGVLLGSIFFGGLWWTIRQGISSRSPAVWFLCSLLLRTGISVSGFYFVSRGDWRKLLACLFGFLLARIFMMRLTRVPISKRDFVVEGSRP